MATEKTAAQKLREPFRPEQIGVLPKPYKADSPKGKCPDCGGYHGLPAVHLDYVGHAAVTDRLLQVDPAWTWEPMALDDAGLPAIDRAGNLWIKLTIDGVTRLGVGDGSSMKERIGDAIRNAAMRFGVALDLWSKEDLALAQQEQEQAQREASLTPEEKAERDVQAAQEGRARRNAARHADPVSNARGRAWDAVTERMPDELQEVRQAAITQEVASRVGWPEPRNLTADQWTELADYYEQETDDAIRARYARGE